MLYQVQLNYMHLTHVNSKSGALYFYIKPTSAQKISNTFDKNDFEKH